MLYTDMYFDYLATRLDSYRLLVYITAFDRCVRRPRCYYRHNATLSHNVTYEQAEMKHSCGVCYFIRRVYIYY